MQSSILVSEVYSLGILNVDRIYADHNICHLWMLPWPPPVSHIVLFFLLTTHRVWEFLPRYHHYILHWPARVLLEHPQDGHSTVNNETQLVTWNYVYCTYSMYKVLLHMQTMSFCINFICSFHSTYRLYVVIGVKSCPHS